MELSFRGAKPLAVVHGRDLDEWGRGHRMGSPGLLSSLGPASLELGLALTLPFASGICLAESWLKESGWVSFLSLGLRGTGPPPPTGRADKPGMRLGLEQAPRVGIHLRTL